jgi:predicted amidohydrolase YtcJ
LTVDQKPPIKPRGNPPPVFLILVATLLTRPCAVLAQFADVIYHGGPILTMDGEAPSYCEAVAVKDGKILFVGSQIEALNRRGDATQLRDLGGKAMLPGFIDAHSHFLFALTMENQVNVASPPVGPAKDIPSTVAAILAYQARAKVPARGWLIGWGYDSERLAEGRHITKQDLDPVFPDHKVILIHVSGHGAVLNSQALAFAGIDANTKTPPGGFIDRLPGSNEPAGLLMETAYLPLTERLPQPSKAELMELMKPAQMMYAASGYTHAQEGFTPLANLDFLLDAAEADKIFLEIASLPSFFDMPKWINNSRYKFGEYRKGLKLQGVKFTQDGSPQAKTAYVSTPYLTGGPSGQPNWRGETTQHRDEFLRQVKMALGAGLQVFIHANGDATIDQVIEAVDQAGIRAANDRRTIVVHSQFQRPDQLDKYVRLGLSPTYFTNHTYFWGDVHVKNIGAEKAAFISPIRAAKAKGLIFSNHTDFNVTPLDPIFVIWTAMARQSRSGRIIGPDQRVDAYTALQALTTGPAWQIFEENRKGKIKTGLLADFVILSADPVRTDIDKIRSIKVLETIKRGKTIYAANL